MRLHTATAVTLYQVTFDRDETRLLREHREFGQWIGLDYGHSRARQMPTSSASLSLSQLERVAIFLDVDYRLAKDAAAIVRNGGRAPKLRRGVAKIGAESVVDRLRIARMA